MKAYRDAICERVYTAPKLDRDSEAYKLMLAAGWTISEPYFADDENWETDHRDMPLKMMAVRSIRVRFKCVCGREEIYVRAIGPGEIECGPGFRNGWDACAEIERAGAISEEHLRADGFDEKQIERVYADDAKVRRIAWRIVKDWADAQMALIEAGQASLVEVFLPYATTDSGETFFQKISRQQFLQLTHKKDDVA